MAQVLAKEYDCMTCHRPIRISKIDNPTAGKAKWDKFETDGVTPHKCKRQQQQQAVVGTDNNNNTGPQLQITELPKKVVTLESKLDILISQIQQLRSEVKSKNG